MGRVFGENFPVFVDKQIKIRQQKNGNKNKFTSKGYSIDQRQSFMRLISSINITDNEILQDIGVTGIGLGSELAKSFILQNGVTDINQTSPSGFKTTNNLGVGQSIPKYGWGGLEQGFRPQPFIESVNISSKNNGSLREGSIKIKAFTTQQFKVIDALYLRLGYTVLIEWGNIEFLDNNNNIQNIASDYKGIKYKLLEGGITLKELHKLIFNQAKEYSGNYDGFIGKVTNFSWTFTPEGIYDITLDLITYGDVIESLNMNTIGGISIPFKQKQTTEGEETDSEEDEISIINQINKNSLGYYIGNLILPYVAKEFSKSFELFSDPTILLSQAIGSLVEDSSLFNPYGTDDFFTIKQQTFFNNALEEYGSSFYIRFGALLEVLQNGFVQSYPKVKTNAIVFDNTDNNGKTIEKALNIDFDSSSNFCMFRNGLFSTNPYVCIVGGYSVFDRPLYRKDNKYWVRSFKMNPSAPQDDNYVGYTKYGKTMNIYINALRFLEIIQEVKDDKNNSSLFEVLKKLCTEINDSLCNVIELEPKYNEFTNSLEIIDNKFIAASVSDRNLKNTIKTFCETNKDEEYAETPTSIQVYGGINTDNGTILRDFEIKTELTKDIATTISIGAQASGDGSSAPNPETTQFLSFNKGHEDRIAPKKIIKKDSQTTKAANEEIQIQKEEMYTSLSDILDYITLEKDGGGSFAIPDKETVGSWSGTLKTFFEFQDFTKKKDVIVNKTLPGSSPIPISLTLKLDGISGIKLFETFKADLQFLPKSYHSVTFIVKGINHEISGNDWITNIETNMVPSSLNENDIQEEPAPTKKQSIGLTTDIINMGNSLVIQNIISDKNINDKIFWLYMSWQQGTTGAAEYYKLIKGRQTKFINVPQKNMLQNWPGKLIARNGVTKNDITKLYNTDPKKLAEGFIDVWKQQFNIKTQNALKLINSNGKNRAGLSYSVIKEGFKFAQINNPLLTVEDLAVFGTIENSLNTDTNLTKGYQTMFQLSKVYGKELIEKHSSGLNPKNGFMTYGHNNFNSFALDFSLRISKKFKEFISLSKYPN